LTVESRKNKILCDLVRMSLYLLEKEEDEMTKVRRILLVAVSSMGLGVGAAIIFPAAPVLGFQETGECIEDARCGGLNCYTPAPWDCREQEVGGCSISTC